MGSRGDRELVSKPLHIGLIMQGGAGWMGGAEYIKNLAHALASVKRAGDDSFRVSILATGLDEEWKQTLSSLAELIPLPSRKRGFIHGLLRTNARAFFSQVKNAGLDFLYPLTYDNEHNLGVKLPIGNALSPARWAGWIPDFQHRQLPQLFNAAEIQRRDSGIAALAADARTIVFSSEACAEDYRQYCPSAQARADVLRFCTAPTPSWYEGNPQAVQAKYHLPDRFFLISNQVWQHKNHLLVFEALALLAARGIHPHVVCTGQPADFRDKNFLNVILQRIHECGVASQVALLGLISRADQIQLMRRSVAVVQPSLCEGWSTVVEDARLLGKNAVLSDLAVHREQNPPGAQFFDRHSAQSLAALLESTWTAGQPGPDLEREAAARTAAENAQLAFGRRFLEIARAT